MRKTNRQIDDLIKRNIEINTARAVRNYEFEKKISEAPEKIKRKFRKEFERASEIERGKK